MLISWGYYKVSWEGTGDAPTKEAAQGKVPFFSTVCQRGVDCVHCLSPLFAVLSLTISPHDPQLPARIPQAGAVRQAPSDPTVGSPSLRVTLQSLLICQYCHTEF